MYTELKCKTYIWTKWPQHYPHLTFIFPQTAFIVLSSAPAKELAVDALSSRFALCEQDYNEKNIYKAKIDQFNSSLLWTITSYPKRKMGP